MPERTCNTGSLETSLCFVMLINAIASDGPGFLVDLTTIQKCDLRDWMCD